MRQTYLLHVMDYICQARERVFRNDMVELEEKNKNRVTLQNVFELAAEKDSN